MKKLIFVMLLSLVSERGYSQAALKKTISQASTYKASTTLTDTVFGQSGTNNAKWAVRDEVTAGDVTGTQGNTFVNSLRNIPISSTAPTTGQVMSYNGTNWGPLTPAAGGGASYKTYTDVTFASSINLNFDATNYYNIPGITGNFTLTGSNNTNGKYIFVMLRKATSARVVINIDPTTFVSPSFETPSVLDSVDATAHRIILNGPSGTVYSMSITYLKEIPEFLIKNVPTSQNANPRVVTDQMFYTSGPMVQCPQNTSENTMYSFTLPGGSVTTGSRIYFECQVKGGNGGFTGNASNAQLKIRANGVTYEDVTIVKNTGSHYREQRVIMNNSLSSQTMFIGYIENQNNTGDETTRSIDFSAPVTFAFSLQQGTGSDIYYLGMVSIKGEGLGL